MEPYEEETLQTQTQTQTQTQPLSAQSSYSYIGGAQPQDPEFAEQYGIPLRTLVGPSRSYLSVASATSEDVERATGDVAGLQAEVARLRVALENAHTDVEQALADAVIARQEADCERKARYELERLLEDVQDLVSARLRGMKRARDEDDEGQDAGSGREKRVRT